MAKKIHKTPITSLTCILVIDQHSIADLLRAHLETVQSMHEWALTLSKRVSWVPAAL